MDEYLPKLSPSLEKLLKYSRATSDDDNQKAVEDAIHVTAQQIHQARMEEEVAVNDLLQEWAAGAASYSFPASSQTMLFISMAKIQIASAGSRSRFQRVRNPKSPS